MFVASGEDVVFCIVFEMEWTLFLALRLCGGFDIAENFFIFTVVANPKPFDCFGFPQRQGAVTVSHANRPNVQVLGMNALEM